MKIVKPIKLTLTLILVSSLTACLTNTTKKGAVGVERQQLMTVSAEDMRKGGEQAYKEVLAEHTAKGTLNTNKKQLQRIRDIANNLIPHTKVFRSDAPKWDWEVNLITSDELNAWIMPGGKIAFYTGIIDKLQLSDGEIAAIMGHEMAHVLREHGRERASQAQLQAAGLQAVGQLTGIQGTYLDMAALAMNVTITLPYSRKHEVEADRIGMELAARAGYDPYDAVRVWERMSQYSKGAPPEILSTHPSNASRIKDLKKYVKKVSHFR